MGSDHREEPLLVEWCISPLTPLSRAAGILSVHIDDSVHSLWSGTSQTCLTFVGTIVRFFSIDTPYQNLFSCAPSLLSGYDVPSINANMSTLTSADVSCPSTDLLA